MQCHWPWLVALFERLSGVKPSLALRKNPSLLLAVVHLDDMRMECGMQQVAVDGAGPTRLLSRPSLVAVAGLAWPSLLRL
jgi:hypothetical protein